MNNIKRANCLGPQRLVSAILVLLFVAQALSLDGRVPFTQYGYEEWRIAEGLPDNNVMAIAQTHDGYLWLGTNEGLSRFNGVEFVNFTTADSEFLPDDRIQSLLTARDGVLWIGTRNGLATWTPDGFVRPPIQAQDNLFAFRMLENHTGEIWVGGDRVFTVAGEIVESMAHGLLNQGDVLSDFSLAFDGSIWLAKDNALFLMHQGVLHPVNEINSRLEGTITCIHEDNSNILWVGTSQGLLRWDGSKVAHYGTENGLTHRNIRCLYEDSDGTLWIGTSYGLNRLAHGVITSDQSVCGNEYIFTVFEDRENNLWVGTYLGLRRLCDQPIRVIGARDGLFHDIVQAIALDRQEVVWMATYQGGLYRYDNNQVVRFGLEMGLGERYVNCMHQGSDGRFWLGLNDGIGFIRDGESILNELRIDHPGAAKDILERANGDLLVALSNGVKQVHSQQLDPYRPDLLPESRALVLHESPDGSLWIGYAQKGLYHVRSGQAEIYTMDHGLPNNWIYSLCEDRQGLWIATKGGIAYLYEDRVHCLSGEQNLFREPAYNVTVDENEDLWFCTSRHLAQLKREDINRFMDKPQASLRARVFGKAEGLHINEWKPSHRGVARQSDGTLWFPSQEGAIVIDPNAVVTNALPPPVYIEQCYIDRRPTDTDRTLRIEPHKKEIEFHYIALNLSDPEGIRYRYRLAGHDSDWIEAGARRVAYYNTLGPGAYRFHVIACNRDGIWNERGATMAFVVLSAYYQTWWFIALVTGISMSLLVGLSRYLILRRIRRKVQLLHQQNTLNRERARIARDIHDDLGAGLTEIALLSELGLKNAASPDKSASFFNRICQSAHHIVGSMDEIVWAVNPKNDTLEHLANYVCHFADSFLKMTSIRCRLDVPALLPDVFLSAEIRHSLFLVVKEALNNVVKHSCATEVRISLSVDNDSIAIRITDNGQGFNGASIASSQGRGMNNMKQRMCALQGQCDIASQSDCGTSVSLRLPLTSLAQRGRCRIDET